MVQNGRRTLEISLFAVPVPHYFNVRLSISLNCKFEFYRFFTWFAVKGKKMALNTLVLNGGTSGCCMAVVLDYVEALSFSFSKSLRKPKPDGILICDSVF